MAEITDAEIVDGVMDLFPGADRQALRCAVELRAKDILARLDAAEARVRAVEAERDAALAVIATLTQDPLDTGGRDG